MTPREAAVFVLGEEAVGHYETVKRFYTRYGNALMDTFADAVGGRVGGRGEPDVITSLGGFEFCAQATTKNSVGDAAQRASGRVVVQVSGRPRPGRITGARFLRMHGIRDAERVAGLCEVAAAKAASP